MWLFGHIVECLYTSVFGQILFLGEHRHSQLAGSAQHRSLGLVEQLQLVLQADQADALLAFLLGVGAAGAGAAR